MPRQASVPRRACAAGPPCRGSVPCAISLIRIHPALVGLPIALLVHGSCYSQSADGRPDRIHDARSPRADNRSCCDVGQRLCNLTVPLKRSAPSDISRQSHGCANHGRGSLLRSDNLLWTEPAHTARRCSFFAFRADLFAADDLQDYGFDYQLACWLAFAAALIAARTVCPPWPDPGGALIRAEPGPMRSPGG